MTFYGAPDPVWGLLFRLGKRVCIVPYLFPTMPVDTTSVVSLEEDV